MPRANRRMFLKGTAALGLQIAAGPLTSQTPRERVVPVELFVAPNGSDRNSGTRLRPLQTIFEARNRIRQARTGGSHGPVRVWLREGLYPLSETFDLTLEDGGTVDAPVAYSAWRSERPVISGGVRINGWRKLDRAVDGLPPYMLDRVWEADLPIGLGLFHTLFSGDRRLPRATSINFWDNPHDTVGDPVAGHANTMARLPPGVVRPWANVSDMEIAVRSINWTVNLLPLASVDPSSNSVTTAVPSTYPLGFKQEPEWERLRVHLRLENAVDFLTGPGQWAVNTLTRKLYLCPLEEEPSNIVAPALKQLIQVSGRLQNEKEQDIPVRQVHFRGLTLRHVDRDVMAAEDSGIQHDWEMVDKADSLLRFRGAEDCSVEGCRLTNSGGTAIRLDLYAQNIRVADNEIAHVGQSGVAIIGYGPGTRHVSRSNVIENNDVHHCGELLEHGLGMVVFQSSDNRIAHNYIHDLPRGALSLTGVRMDDFRKGRSDHPRRETERTIRWNEIDPEDVSATYIESLTVPSPNDPRKLGYRLPVMVEKYLHTRDNIVEQNEIARCLGKLSDGAAIDVTGAGTGNICRGNYLHDIDGAPGEEPTSCMRTDDSQWGTLFAENVIANSSVRAFEHKCVNAVLNNVVVNVRTDGVINILDRWGPFGDSRLERNIFIECGSEPALFYHVFRAKDYGRLAGATIDYNIYFNAFSSDRPGADLIAMRAVGLESHSLLVDPQLMDWRNGDFRLRPDSPAHKLHIVSVDISQAGLRVRATDYRGR